MKSTCEIVSYWIWWLKFEISCSLKEIFWKTSQNSQNKHKEQSSGSVQSKDALKNFVKFTGKTSLPDSTKLQAGNLKPAEVAAGDSL